MNVCSIERNLAPRRHGRLRDGPPGKRRSFSPSSCRLLPQQIRQDVEPLQSGLAKRLDVAGRRQPHRRIGLHRGREYSYLDLLAEPLTADTASPRHSRRMVSMPFIMISLRWGSSAA